MREFEKLKLTVNDCRAVKSAIIEIGDITVLSGVNASGKSTLAHLVHSLINLNREYKNLALETVCRRINRVLWRMRRFKERLYDALEEGDDILRRLPQDMGYVFDRQRRADTIESRADALAEEFELATSGYRKLQQQDCERAERLLNSFVADLPSPEDMKVDLASIKDWIDWMIASAREEYGKLLKNRSSNVWRVANSRALRWIQYPGHVELKEGEVSVYDSDRADGGISEILNIDHAFYIESPWQNMPDVNRDGRLSINDGFDFFPSEEDFTPDETLFAALGGNVVDNRDKLEGAVQPRLPYGVHMWTFKRTDGRGEYPLDECATGMRAFSILNFLYTRNLLNNRTLLVVDEPEAHLHPQWILEYAKVLVRLNRNLGVRLLLTTHSPDMLNAIRRVANVEEVPDLRFYLAKNNDLSKSLQYDYVSLGRNVEPIFAAFNMAADKTETYPFDE